MVVVGPFRSRHLRFLCPVPLLGTAYVTLSISWRLSNFSQRFVSIFLHVSARAPSLAVFHCSCTRAVKSRPT